MVQPVAVIILFSLFSTTTSFAQLQKLIDEAPPRSQLRVPPGRHVGHFTVTKPITLYAKQDAVLDGQGNGSVLRIRSSDVVIDGLIVQNSGTSIGNADSAIVAENADRFELRNSIIRNSLFGVQLLASRDALIQRNDIRSFSNYELGRRGDVVKIWYSPGTKLLDNRIRDGRDVLVWYSDGSIVRGNAVENMRYGLHYMYSHKNEVRENEITLNSVGIYCMYSNDMALVDNTVSNNRGPSGYGIAFKESDRIRVSKNRLESNRIGLYVDNTPLSPAAGPSETTTFTENWIARNDVGVAFVGGGAGSHFMQNDFVDNWQQVSTKGLQRDVVIWKNNFWSDYRGIDPGRTGLGIIPHVADSLASDITDRIEGFKLFNFGPAMLALHFAERIVPWLKPAPKVVDHVPTMKPHNSPRRATTSPIERLWMLSVSLALGMLVWGIRRGFAL